MTRVDKEIGAFNVCETLKNFKACLTTFLSRIHPRITEYFFKFTYHNQNILY